MHNPPKPRNINDFIKWRDQAAYTTFLALGLSLLALGVAWIGVLGVSWAMSEPPVTEQSLLPACDSYQLQALAPIITACAANNEVYKVEACMKQAQISICTSTGAAESDAVLLEMRKDLDALSEYVRFWGRRDAEDRARHRRAAIHERDGAQGHLPE